MVPCLKSRSVVVSQLALFNEEKLTLDRQSLQHNLQTFCFPWILSKALVSLPLDRIAAH